MLSQASHIIGKPALKPPSVFTCRNLAGQRAVQDARRKVTGHHARHNCSENAMR
jgi:hypothetical protein